jgi:subfamily B ATP-binding cassette protein MsbA
LVELLVAIGTSMVLWFGARAVLHHDLSTGSLILFVFYLAKMYKPMRDLSKVTDTYSRAAVGYERIQEIMERHHEVRDLPGARPAPPLMGHIEFDRVCFSYDPRSPVLKGVAFRIEAGQTAALVGRTGSGKTTIISLLTRFYDLDTGVIRIDGRDIRSFTLESLRRQISFVLQETLLCHGPLWYNIAYGKPGASRSEILRAARLANVDEFIEKLPNGYDTVVGERGVTLSGGQRQRVAIARAVIRNSPILVLDEPTTGLDAGSEQIVFEALDRLREGKASIVIAHRLSTIRHAELILVLQDGIIVEQGRHEQLLKSGGPYAQFYELQTHATESLVS